MEQFAVIGKSKLITEFVNQTRAADVYSGLPEVVNKDFRLARVEMGRVFMNPAKTVLYQNEFDNRIQGEKETLQDLVTALRRLAKRGYPEVASDSRALDSFVHRRFIEAIRDPKLRTQVRLFRRDTVEQTLVEAYRLQAALATEKESSRLISAVSTDGRQPSNGNWNQGNRNRNTHNYGNRNQNFQSYGNRNQNSRNQNGLHSHHQPSAPASSDNRACFACGQVGHIARNCNSRYGSQWGSGSGSQNLPLKD